MPPTPRKLKMSPDPEELTLLRVGGRNGRIYRCEVDPAGHEHWFVIPPTTALEWISPAEAARLRRLSREAIGRAVAHKRLTTVDCNGRPKVCRADVLALTVQYRKSPPLKPAQRRTNAAEPT